MVFCFWSLLLSSSAVEAQHCLHRRSPCVRRRQRVRGPSLLAPKKRRPAAGALADIQQRCREYRGPLLLASKTPMRLLRRRRPCVHRRQCCQGHLLLAHFPSSFRRRLPRYHITGPASLAEQIDLTCKRGSVGQSEGLPIPRSSVQFRLKPDNSNFHEFELHRPSNKGTKLLLKVIKAIIII